MPAREARSADGGSAARSERGGLERLELRVERLDVTFRFTFAFHAREVRFERSSAEASPEEEAEASPGGRASYERVFPETFSFHRERHDPAELSLQLDDLLRKPRLLSPRAHRRDARELVTRLLTQAPRYLKGMCERLEATGSLDETARLRVNQDVALLCQLLMRFLETSGLGETRSARVAGFLLRRQIFRSLMVLVRERVDPAWLERWVAGEVDAVDPSDDPSESGFFHVLEAGRSGAARGGGKGESGESGSEIVDRMIVRMAERAFYMWLEGVCLDEDNQAFEKEDSPFDAREVEVLAAIAESGSGRVERASDLVPFLRRASLDCRRVLEKLEAWFLRQYDIEHSSAVIHHAAYLAGGGRDEQRKLSWHKPRLHALALFVLAAPFVAAAFAYEQSPRFFDWLCALEVACVYAGTAWFLLYRFCWKRDLSFFHSSVPRIAAGIIVGYLPVLFIDEVWDLASRSWQTLASLGVLLGLVTLLYIYVEIQRRLGDTTLAFARARAIFLLGVLEAFAAGLIVTSLVGRIMAGRNWSPDGGEIPVEALRETVLPFVGQLPRIVGIEPLYAFPSAIVLMTFLSFFIGIFLQLMWEELPFTEPL